MLNPSISTVWWLILLILLNQYTPIDSFRIVCVIDFRQSSLFSGIDGLIVYHSFSSADQLLNSKFAIAIKWKFSDITNDQQSDAIPVSCRVRKVGNQWQRSTSATQTQKATTSSPTFRTRAFQEQVNFDLCQNENHRAVLHIALLIRHEAILTTSVRMTDIHRQIVKNWDIMFTF